MHCVALLLLEQQDMMSHFKVVYETRIAEHHFLGKLYYSIQLIMSELILDCKIGAEMMICNSKIRQFDTLKFYFIFYTVQLLWTMGNAKWVE